MSKLYEYANFSFVVSKDSVQVAVEASNIVERLYKAKTRPEKACFNLGLATGGTPVLTYQELIKKSRHGSIDFSRIETFNLDEYLGLHPTHDQSYAHFMNHNLFSHVPIPSSSIHIPKGYFPDLEESSLDDVVKKECEEYEKLIVHKGGVDLWLIGIGRNGHIAFNEPGSSKSSRTRIVELTKDTIEANTRFFTDSDCSVPSRAVSVGIGTICEAREILLIATGANKQQALYDMVFGEPEHCPAAWLRGGAPVHVCVDESAFAKLEKHLEK
ncbi:Glucosamine-6-phosphate isomerase like protein [Aduncisulcus paluster]|uniref:Glucosamine-6-phosphate isomerase n=1 Tax=Aduncisulcus paluster TaxID=2918883 RepID=A0ABQ5KS96_9EUKA|nr:Glucosamine-6-phosphate isomerase like protein [Aduncisulcus paluster]